MLKKHVIFTLSNNFDMLFTYNLSMHSLQNKTDNNQLKLEPVKRDQHKVHGEAVFSALCLFSFRSLGLVIDNLKFWVLYKIV